MGILSAFRFTFQNLFFSPILYGVIASLALFSSVWDKGDRFKDQLTDRFRSQDDTFDFVIVGGGSAGAVLAYRLSEYHTVLLLEAGGESHPFQAIPGLSIFLPKHPGTDWMHKSVTQSKSCLACRHKKYIFSQGKNLGGSGNLNYLVHLRGNPLDYDNWATITGDPSWSYDGVLPYFIQSEHYIGDTTDKTAHGHGGPLQIQVPDCIGLAAEWNLAGIEMGYPHIDLNGKHAEGFDTIFYPIKNGVRQATYRSYIQPVRNRPSLLIRKFAHVNKVLIREGTNDAYGVEYDRHGQHKFAFANKEVILSAGTLQTPKLLVLSGVGQLEHLKALHIPVKSVLPVGKNLQDHISTLLGPFYINKPKTISLDRDIDKQSFIQFTTSGKGPLTTSGFQAAAVVSSALAKAQGQGGWPDIQLTLFGLTPHRMFYSDISHAFGIREDILRKYYGDVTGKENAFFIMVTVARPLSKGDFCVPSKDPYKPAVIDPNHFSDELGHDVKVMTEGIHRALFISENTTVFNTLGTVYSQKCLPGCENIPFRSDVYWECYVRAFSVANNDHVGTCAMGKVGSPYAVVDPHLQVQGTRGLRVVDASVMPTIVGTPTQAATIMIAEKGASLILEKWKNEAKNNYGPPGKISGTPIQYGPPGKHPGPPIQYGPPGQYGPPSKNPGVIIQYGPPGKNPNPPIQYGPPVKYPYQSIQYGIPGTNPSPPIQQYGPPPTPHGHSLGTDYGPPGLSSPPLAGGDVFSNYDSFSVIKDQLAPSFGTGPGPTNIIPLQPDTQVWSTPEAFPNSGVTAIPRDILSESFSTPPPLYKPEPSQLLLPPDQSQGSPAPPAFSYSTSDVDFGGFVSSTPNYPVTYNLDASRSEKSFVASDFDNERVDTPQSTYNSSDLRRGKSLQGTTPIYQDENQLGIGFDSITPGPTDVSFFPSSTTAQTPYQPVTETEVINEGPGFKVVRKRIRTTPRVIIHPRGHLGHQNVRRNKEVGLKLNETLADLFLTTSTVRPVPKEVVKIKRRRPGSIRKKTTTPASVTTVSYQDDNFESTAYGNDLANSFTTYTTPAPFDVPQELKQTPIVGSGTNGKKRFVRRMYARPFNFNGKKRTQSRYSSEEPIAQAVTPSTIYVQAPSKIASVKKSEYGDYKGNQADDRIDLNVNSEEASTTLFAQTDKKNETIANVTIAQEFVSDTPPVVVFKGIELDDFSQSEISRQTRSDAENNTKTDVSHNLLTEESRNPIMVVDLNPVPEIIAPEAAMHVGDKHEIVAMAKNPMETSDYKDDAPVDFYDYDSASQELNNSTSSVQETSEDLEKESDSRSISQDNVNLSNVATNNSSSLQDTYEDDYDETPITVPPVTTVKPKPTVNSRLAFRLRHNLLRSHS